MERRNSSSPGTGSLDSTQQAREEAVSDPSPGRRSTVPLEILLIEDDADHAALIRRHLADSKEGLHVHSEGTLAGGLQWLAERSVDGVLLDLGLPDSALDATLERVLSEHPDVPVVVLTSLGDLEFATRALGRGAEDYVVKSQIDGEQLERALRYAVERKRIARERERHAAELARSNQELQQFAHTVAHELRSPLNTFILSCELLRDTDEETEREEIIASMQKAASGMGELVTELLRFASLESKDQVPGRVSMERALAKALEDLRAARTDSGAEVTHDPLPEVIGHRVQLEQLLQNLIANGLRSHSDRPPRVHVQGSPCEEGWRFCVRDDGPPIPAEQQERVFQIFRGYGRDPTRRRTGIGLAFCKRVVEHHGGRIWVESGPDTGTEFHFLLPRPD